MSRTQLRRYGSDAPYNDKKDEISWSLASLFFATLGLGILVLCVVVAAHILAGVR